MKIWNAFLAGSFCATWLILIATTNYWLFIPALSILLISALTGIGEYIYKAGMRKGSVK